MFKGLRHTLHQEEVNLFERVLSGMTGNGVEIGSLDGYSATVILNASGITLTCIDPFIPDSMDPSTQGNAQNAWRNLEVFEDRVYLIVDYSHEVVKHWYQELDFLFIDGDHTLEAVQRDYEQWVPFLKNGSLLAMHDSRINRGAPIYWPGPSEVADLYVYGQPDVWDIVGEAQTLTVARKKWTAAP